MTFEELISNHLGLEVDLVEEGLEGDKFVFVAFLDDKMVGTVSFRDLLLTAITGQGMEKH